MAKLKGLTRELESFDGKPIPRGNDTDENWTLGAACCEALMGFYNDEQNLDGDKKLLRHLLARRIHTATEKGLGLSVKAEDITLLKALSAKLFSPRLLGPVWEALDPSEPEEVEAPPIEAPVEAA